jgi:hypothetical protein
LSKFSLLDKKGGLDIIMNSKHSTQYWLNIILSIIHQISCIAFCRLETMQSKRKGCLTLNQNNMWTVSYYYANSTTRVSLAQCGHYNHFTECIFLAMIYIGNCSSSVNQYMRCRTRAEYPIRKGYLSKIEYKTMTNWSVYLFFF